jgi:hypothetical protein
MADYHFDIGFDWDSIRRLTRDSVHGRARDAGIGKFSAMSAFLSIW